MLFFSQYWGAKDDDGITRSYGLTLLFMLSVRVAVCLSCAFCTGICHARLYG